MRTSTSCKESKVSQIHSQGQSQSTDLLVAEVQELIELDATVGEGSEDSFFLEFGSDLGVGNISHGWCVEYGLEMWMWSEGGTGYSGELYSRSHRLSGGKRFHDRKSSHPLDRIHRSSLED